MMFCYSKMHVEITASIFFFYVLFLLGGGGGGLPIAMATMHVIILRKRCGLVKIVNVKKRFYRY